MSHHPSPNPVVPHGLQGVSLKDALQAAMATPPPPDCDQRAAPPKGDHRRKPKADKK